MKVVGTSATATSGATLATSLTVTVNLGRKVNGSSSNFQHSVYTLSAAAPITTSFTYASIGADENTAISFATPSSQLAPSTRRRRSLSVKPKPSNDHVSGTSATSVENRPLLEATESMPTTVICTSG